jgi:hypothetical protein
VKMTRAVRWWHIRREIRKNPGRLALLMLAKWVLDREIRSHNLCAIVVRDGCGASFGVSSVEWNCDVPGGEMILVVNPVCLGSNCDDFRDLHSSDHALRDLIYELQARGDAVYDAAHPAAEKACPKGTTLCYECGVESVGGLCDACVVNCEAFWCDAGISPRCPSSMRRFIGGCASSRTSRRTARRSSTASPWLRSAGRSGTWRSETSATRSIRRLTTNMPRPSQLLYDVVSAVLGSRDHNGFDMVEIYANVTDTERRASHRWRGRSRCRSIMRSSPIIVAGLVTLRSSAAAAAAAWTLPNASITPGCGRVEPSRDRLRPRLFARDTAAVFLTTPGGVFAFRSFARTVSRTTSGRSTRSIICR